MDWPPSHSQVLRTWWARGWSGLPWLAGMVTRGWQGWVEGSHSEEGEGSHRPPESPLLRLASSSLGAPVSTGQPRHGREMTPVVGREAAGFQSPATSFNLQRSELSAEASPHSAGWRTLPLGSRALYLGKAGSSRQLSLSEFQTEGSCS